MFSPVCANMTQLLEKGMGDIFYKVTILRFPTAFISYQLLSHTPFIWIVHGISVYSSGHLSTAYYHTKRWVLATDCRNDTFPARFVFRIVRSLWNLTGTSAAVLPMCLSNFKAIRQLKVPISWLRDFTRSYEKTSFRILRRGPGGVNPCEVAFVFCPLYQHIKHLGK